MIRHLYLAAVIYGPQLAVAFVVGVRLTHLINRTIARKEPTK